MMSWTSSFSRALELAVLVAGVAAQTVSMASAPNPLNLLVVRSAGGVVNLDEYASTSLQSAYVQTVFVIGCSLSLSAQQGYGTNSVDGQFALFSCGTTSNATRIVARVSSAGQIDLSTTYTTTSASYLPRGAASPDGVSIYASDGAKFWHGTFGGLLSQLTAVEYYYGMQVQPINGVQTALYLGCTGSGVPCTGSLYYGSVALPTLAIGTFNTAITGLTSLVDPGMFVVSPFPATTTTIYYGSDVTSGGLYRLTSASGTGASGSWSVAVWATGSTVKNPAATAVGVHGMAYRTEGTAFVLYLTTSASIANQLWRYDTTYDTSATVGAGYTRIATAPSGNQFSSVFVVPTSPSMTPSTTPSVSASVSGSVSPSLTVSGSSSLSFTPSGSSSLSVGSSPSVTLSPSQTPVATPTQTGTSQGTPMPTQSPHAVGVIFTVVGNGVAGWAGDGGPATLAVLNQPNGVAVSSNGDIYVVDWANQLLRRVFPNGTIATVAGNGDAGYNGDGIPATDASLYGPVGVALDAGDNAYIADASNNRVRKVLGDGTIQTVVGTGVAGFSGDGIPASSAQLNHPYSLAFDSSRNMYITDALNSRIRVVNTAGIIGTLAGTGTAGFSGDNGVATLAMINGPFGVAVDDVNNVYFSDLQNSRVRQVSFSGIIRTIAGTGTAGYNGDGRATAAQLNQPSLMAVDGDGNVLVADFINNCIRSINPSTGYIVTIAGTSTKGFSGDGSSATSAKLNNPRGVAVDASSSVYIGDDANNRVRKIVRRPSTTSSSSSSPTNSVSSSISSSSSSTVSPSASVTSSSSRTSAASKTASSSSTASSRNTLTETITGTLSETPSSSGTPLPSSTCTFTASYTDSAAPSPTQSPTNSLSRTHSPTHTTSRSAAATVSSSRTTTPSDTPSLSPSSSSSSSATQTASPSSVPTGTPSPSATHTAVHTPSSSSSGAPTATPSVTGTPSPSLTQTATRTPPPSATGTPSPSATWTVTRTPASSGTPPPTSTRTPTASQSATQTSSKSATTTRTSTRSPTGSRSATRTQTATASVTRTPTRSHSAAQTLSATPSLTITPPPTVYHGISDGCGHGGPCPNRSPTNTRTKKPK